MKRIISLVLALVLCIGLIPLASAASAPVKSSNIDGHWYVNAERWATPIHSSLAYENGQYVRAEYIGDELVVEYYDQSFNFLSGKTIPLELPIFGGVRMDSDYNFLVVGQTNFEEDDSREVFRIIRYTKDWKKVDHTSIYGANTTVPFDAGSCRFDRSGGILYIRTCHEMYADENGTNHQANVMIALRVSDMTVTDQLTRVLNSSYGYVSHSFNQFVRVDGETLLAVDHGDYYPRSVALFKYSKKAGSETFYGRTTMVNALPIVNSTYHYNDTGVSVGCFEFSSSHYLIAGNSYDQKEPADLMNVHRNIFVTATPKDNFTDEGTQVNWITGYKESDGVKVSPPHLLKVSSDRFLLTWTENDVVKYCFLNGKGQPEDGIQTMDAALSDCVPILVNGKAVWYVTDFSAPVFYQINTVRCAHSYSDYRCIHCGELKPTPFHDVEDGRYYHIPVLWAVEKGVTYGLSGTEFGTEEPCTRAQVVTILYRAAGSPAPKSTTHSFVDVKKGSFYEKAVLWAVENGITVGTDATHFDPDAPCTRSAVVTFLWRAKGKPSAPGSIPFTDVPASSWYAAPIRWAVKNGITQGVSATEFGTNDTCTRAQVVTFLYRAFA